MKVKLEINTIDEAGDLTPSSFMAIMEKCNGAFPYRLVYVERISDDGKQVAKSELMLAPGRMRMVRKGDIESDFLYENGLVHNTTYKTVYGSLPITLETKNYEMKVLGDCDIVARAVYYLTIQSEEPMYMDVSIKISPFEE